MNRAKGQYLKNGRVVEQLEPRRIHVWLPRWSRRRDHGWFLQLPLNTRLYIGWRRP